MFGHSKFPELDPYLVGKVPRNQQANEGSYDDLLAALKEADNAIQKAIAHFQKEVKR